MKVPYNWLRQYVEIDLPPDELADRLTMAGIEVDSVSLFAPLGENIVVASVEELSRHPRSPNLQVVRVNAGGTRHSVVCGAWNIDVGDKVPLALPGAVLPAGYEIKEAEIKGVLSAGMLCSPVELGLDIVHASENGILVLDGGCSAGEKLDDILFTGEPVLELALTPNRADCLGLLGVAREVAAVTGARLLRPSSKVQETGADILELAGVQIMEPELCSRYTARMMVDVNVAPSPLDMQLKLLAAGIRPINNIVDVTNYVMWETGHPMHAFDYDRLEEGKIIVRRASAGEEIYTLDGVKRTLHSDILVIADSRVPVGIGGVMGGENTEIGEQTRRVLMEAACFDPVNIRKTARYLNLPSEASQRFEKGVDRKGVLFAQDRAAKLVRETAGGKICRGLIDCYPRKYRQPVISLRSSKVNEVLGCPVDSGEIKEILVRLGLEVKEVKGARGRATAGNRFGDQFTVTVPSHRRDLALEVDLIEEIARIKGYNTIPSTLPRGAMIMGRPSRSRRLMARIRDSLVACGLQEVITFSFMNPRRFDELNIPGDDSRRHTVRLKNPLTEEQEVMRTTLVPGMLQVLEYNFNRQVENVLLFELGKVYMPLPGKEKLPREKDMLAFCLSGKTPEENWHIPSRPVDFYNLKGITEALFEDLGIEGCCWRAEELPLLHPTRGAGVFVEEEKRAGFMGILHPFLQERLGFKQEVFIAELDVDVLLAAASETPSAGKLPRFPAILRDMAFVVPELVTAEELVVEIRRRGGELLEEVKLFDVYKGRQIPEGQVSLAFSLTFRHGGRTLKDEEVDAIQEELKKALSEKYNAVQRELCRAKGAVRKDSSPV